MMFSTANPRLVDAILNHPDVRPTFEQGCYRLSSVQLLNQPGTLVYACPTGLAIFKLVSNGVYEGHIAFLRAGRGKVALAGLRTALDRLFSRHNAVRVVAAVPLQLRGARLVCRLLRFKSVGLSASGKAESFVLEKEKWVG